MFEILILVAFYLVVFPSVTYAYLDPGTGSYFIQIVIGFLLGGAYIIKRYFQQIKTFFVKKFRNSESNEKDKD